MLHKLLGLALAGAVGTLCRDGLSGLVQKSASSAFPWGTLSVNAIGCFLFGFIWTLCLERLIISGEMRVVILTGFLGAFTTFSAFVFETDQLIGTGQWFFAGMNILASLAAGLIAYMLGGLLGRAL